MEYPNGLNIKDFYFSDEIVKWNGTLNSADISDQNLFYGTDGTQTIVFDFGSYLFVSFNVVDANRLTIDNLFSPMFNDTNIRDLTIWDESWAQYNYNGSKWSGSGQSNTAIRFDKGYYVKFETSNSGITSTNMVINGKYIWKTNITLTKGWNFTGWPNNTDGIDLASTAATKGLFYFPSTTSSSIKLWDNLLKIFNAGGASYANGGGNPSTGMLTNDPGKAFIIEMDDDANSYTYSYQNDEVQPTLLQITNICLLYTSPSPRDRTRSRMPSSA